MLIPVPSEHRAHPLPTQPRLARRYLRRPVASALVLVGVGAISLGACGTPPKTLASGPSTTLVPGAVAPLPGVVTAAPTVPPSTAKATPECGAMYQFQSAQFGAVSVTPDKQQAFIGASNATATAAKVAIPELAPSIAVLDDLLPKSVANSTTAAEKESLKQASATLDAWWTKTCL